MREVPKEIQEQNKILARSIEDGGLGTIHGIPRYQWLHSDGLRMPVIVYHEDGSPELDFWCACGKNVSVHSPECRTLSAAAVKWEFTSLVEGLDNQWVMCHWMPPPKEEIWRKQFFGCPYPARGYYLPVTSIGSSGRTLALDPGELPFEQTTRAIIKGFRDMMLQTREDRESSRRGTLAAKTKKQKENLKMAYKEAFSVSPTGAGTKANVSLFSGRPDEEVVLKRPRSVQTYE